MLQNHYQNLVHPLPFGVWTQFLGLIGRDYLCYHKYCIPGSSFGMIVRGKMAHRDELMRTTWLLEVDGCNVSVYQTFHFSFCWEVSLSSQNDKIQMFQDSSIRLSYWRWTRDYKSHWNLRFSSFSLCVCHLIFGYMGVSWWVEIVEVVEYLILRHNLARMLRLYVNMGRKSIEQWTNKDAKMFFIFSVRYSKTHWIMTDLKLNWIDPFKK